MSVKLERITRTFLRIIGGDSLPEPTLEEKAAVMRIITKPSGILPKDVAGYKKQRLNSIFPTTTSTTHPLSMSALQLLLKHMSMEKSYQEELARQKELTPEQLNAEVIADAQKKAKEWGLLS